MKKILLFLLLLMVISFGFSKEVSPEKAQAIGISFLSKTSKREIVDLQLIYTISSKTLGSFILKDPMPYFYVFNTVQNTGFVMVAADDRSFPILAYSNESTFDPEQIPNHLLQWLDGYSKQIRYIIDNDIVATDAIKQEWAQLKNNTYAKKSITAVTPLLQVKWSQSPYYNALCPGGSVTGCVATALAQVMKYWNYPEQGTGFHSYNHGTYGTLSANFGSTTYQWSSMPNGPLNSNNNAVATLMYHCGVAVEMDYSPQSSGAYVAYCASPIEHCTEHALKNYFKYKSSLKGVCRQNYNDALWINLMKSELDARRPLLYAGTGPGGGHAFVCDGYDNNGYFHFNWGWDGSCDGYYAINALNPTDPGTGGGAGSYNSNQHMIIGVEPSEGGGGGGGGSTANLVLYQPLNISTSTIYYGQTFSASTNIANMGSTTFTGDYGAAIFDESLTFIDFVQVLQGYSLDPGYVYNNNLIFSTQGLLSMLPGNYYIAIFYRITGGNWEQVGNGNYSNIAQMKVINPSSIEMNSTMSLSGDPIQGKTFSVNLNVGNVAQSTFIGTYGVGLFDMFTGTLAQEIGYLEETEGLPPGYTYIAPFLTFSTASITVPPGTYLLAVQYKPKTGNWTLVGSSYYPNPIKITVKEAATQADSYEPNDVAAQASDLPVTFSGNKVIVKTNNANIHHGEDIDYYKITLPTSSAYNFKARLHDSENSGDGKNYTVNAIFCYSLDGVNGSEVFDYTMSERITVPNGGMVYFLVAPYFSGNKGTYTLEIDIEKGTASIENESIANNVAIFPNPTSGTCFVKAENVKEISVYNQLGQIMKHHDRDISDDVKEIDMKPFAQGIYFIKIATGQGVSTKKIIKK